MNTRVLAIHSGVGAAQRYRCLHLRQQLGLYQIPCRVQEFRGEPIAADQHYDLTLFHRIPLDGYVEKLVGQIRGRGGLVLFDTDDLVFDSTAAEWVRGLSEEDAIRIRLHRRDVDSCRRMLATVDAVLASTNFLARQASALGTPAWVHRNAFSLEMLSISQDARAHPKRRDGRVVIGYASGTPTHNRDFQEARPAIRRILGKRANAELRIIGPLDPGDGWGPLRNRISHLPLVPWRHLPYVLAQFDINIAPLEPGNPFCQAKSEAKYIEAALVGIPTVASKTEAFEFAVRSGENGFLVANHAEWAEALERLVDDAALRLEMGERAHDDVLARYHPIARGRELVSTLSSIAQEVRGRPLWQQKAITPLDTSELHNATLSANLSGEFDRTDRYPSLITRSVYAVRYRGPGIFFMQVWVFLKRRFMRLVGQSGAG